MRLIPFVVLVAAGCSVGEQSTGALGDGHAPESIVPVAVAPPGQADPIGPSSEEAPPAEPLAPEQTLAVYGFQLQSETWVDATGVAITEDGELAHAGLGTVSCDVNTDYGDMGMDYYDAGDDNVVDVGVVGAEEAFLVITPGAVNVHPVYSGHTSESYNIPGVTNARFRADGLVAIARNTQGCTVGWFAPDGSILSATTFGIAGDRCDGAFAIDEPTGLAWIATPDGVLELAPGATRVIDTAPNAQLAFTGDALFVGAVDGRLTALELDGSERFTTQLGDTISVLTADPAHGAVLAAVESNLWEVHMVDARDASELGRFSYSASARGLAVSGDGSRLVLNTHAGLEFHNIIEN